MTRPEVRCGTVAGYAAHRARKESTCQLCRDARRDYYAERAISADPCVADGCSRPSVAKGLCGPHRTKQRRNGDPNVDRRQAKHSFWDRVSTGPVPDYAPALGHCWLWRGTKTMGGYGRIVVRGRQTYAHRWAYESMVAKIPDGLTIDHLCRVRHCVNPFHMEPVTLAENTRREMEARKAA